MTHRGILLPAALLAAFLMAGCARNQGTGSRPVTVGFAQIGAESGWRTAETQSIREEAKKRGMVLQFSDAQQKQENEIKAIRSFVAQKVDAIILAPVVETGWEPALREARKARIPVILADRAITVQDPDLYVTLVSPDVVEEGRMAGRWMAKALNGKGNIVELKGTVGSSPANDREKGFHEILAQYPGLKVIRAESGDFTRARGKEVMEAFLKTDAGRIDGLYAHNDDMALGAIQAIEAAGLKPGSDIRIVSIDAVHDAFVAMASGKLNGTVECNPLLGPAIFDAIEAHRAGKVLPKKISLKERLYEASEARAVLPTRKY